MIGINQSSPSSKSPICEQSPQIRGVKLIFTGGHISLVVAFKGPCVILGLYKCNYSFLSQGQGVWRCGRVETRCGPNKTRWKDGFGPQALCLLPVLQILESLQMLVWCGYYSISYYSVQVPILHPPQKMYMLEGVMPVPYVQREPGILCDEFTEGPTAWCTTPHNGPMPHEIKKGLLPGPGN